MKWISRFLVLLVASFTAHSATLSAVRINSDTTGTNTRSASVTIPGLTNLTVPGIIRGVARQTDTFYYATAGSTTNFAIPTSGEIAILATNSFRFYLTNWTTDTNFTHPLFISIKNDSSEYIYVTNVADTLIPRGNWGVLEPGTIHTLEIIRGPFGDEISQNTAQLSISQVNLLETRLTGIETDIYTLQTNEFSIGEVPGQLIASQYLFALDGAADSTLPVRADDSRLLGNGVTYTLSTTNSSAVPIATNALSADTLYHLDAFVVGGGPPQSNVFGGFRVAGTLMRGGSSNATIVAQDVYVTNATATFPALTAYWTNSVTDAVLMVLGTNMPMRWSATVRSVETALAAPVAASTYMREEEFESGTIPTYFSDTGVEEYGYASFPLAGLKSLRVHTGVVTLSNTNIAANPAERWTYLKMKWLSNTATSNVPLIGMTAWQLQSRSDYKLRASFGNTTIGTSFYTHLQEVSVWIKYIRATSSPGSDGTLAIYIQTNGTEIRPASPELLLTTGSIFSNNGNLNFYPGVTVDKIRISETEIGDNPL